jgi:hypothetical protein
MPGQKMRLVIFNIAILLAFSFTVMGQAPPEPPPRLDPSVSPSPSEPKRSRLIPRYTWVYEYRFTSEEKKLLAPAATDQERCASFLRLPDTGLIRLYPLIRWRRVISIDDLGDQRSPQFSAHASIFSFSKNRHGSALNGFVDPRLGWAELKLRDGKFFTGFTGESLGVMVALGNTPLEAITPETQGVRGLTNITPPADYLEASALSRRNRAGFELDKFSYGSSLPVAANTTFVLRSTSNGRADLLVAFRVLRVETDGAVTILWRKLKSYPKPEWKRRQ